MQSASGAFSYKNGVSSGNTVLIWGLAVLRSVLLGGTAKLAVIVAGGGDPHLEHVDRVVEVGEPAFTAEVIVWLLYTSDAADE